MPRPVLPLGSYGEINVREEPRAGGKVAYRARALFREGSGAVVEVVKYGPTPATAKRKLRADLVDRQERLQDSLIGPDTALERLAAHWLEHGVDWSTGTQETYALTVKNQVVPYLGGVRVGEARAAVLNRAIARIVERHGPSSAKTTKKVLSGMFRLAVEHEAILANPARDLAPIRTARAEAVRALTPSEVDQLCDALRTDATAVEHDLPDLVEWMLATGARIGEAIAARPSALDLTAGTWEINATLKRVKGTGLVIQPRPKTAAGWRVLALPGCALEILRRRDTEIRHRAPQRAVFPSPRGNALRDPSNTARDLRHALDRAGFPWVHSHVFRKTVATRLDEAGLSARVIADQLGHAKPSMTQDVYLGRRVVSAEAARILDR